MYYLRTEDGTFCFVVDSLHTILDTDIPVLEKDYLSFFEKQAQGKQFKLKEQLPQTGSLFDYIEEYIPEVPERQPMVFSTFKTTENIERVAADIIFDQSNGELHYAKFENSNLTIENGVYLLLLNYHCNVQQPGMSQNISIKVNDDEIASNKFMSVNGEIRGQISATIEVSENCIIKCHVESEEAMYRILSDTKLTIYQLR